MMEGEVARDPERDADMDRLLRSVLSEEPAGAAGACPSAEDLAAYAEGALARGERAEVEEHLAACGRCQDALALVAAMPAAPSSPAAATPGHAWWRAGWKRWLVPVSAVAGGLLLWVAVQPDVTLQPAVPSAVTVPAPHPDADPPGTTPGAGTIAENRVDEEASPRTQEVPRRAPDEGQVALKGEPSAERRLAPAPGASDSVASPAPKLVATQVAEAPPPPPPPVAAPAGEPRPPAIPLPAEAARQETFIARHADEARPAGAARMLAEQVHVAGGAPAEKPGQVVVIGSEGARVRWRIEGRLVSRSDDGGGSWRMVHRAGGDLLAGASPSPEVCWVVGSAGLVLLTTGGERWERLAFPEPVDLVAVSAASALQAVVTSRDGRRFATDDGGTTWR